MRPSSRTARVVLALALVAPALAGCGYSIRPPFAKDIKTVYVPIFRSFSYRRDLNLQLTQLVQDEIRNRTPFKVVGEPDGADSTLLGTIKYVDKFATVESPNNLPRQVQATLQVDVKWVDNRIPDENDRKVITPATFYEQVNFYPELGETSELGFQKALQKLAKQIVDSMEQPW